MSKFTESARNQPCTVRIPFVCQHDDSKTVLAHINGVRFGHGVGIKTKLGAYACAACHDVLDGRVNRPEGMTMQDVKLAHYEGTMETIIKMIEKGVLK